MLLSRGVCRSMVFYDTAYKKDDIQRVFTVSIRKKLNTGPSMSHTEVLAMAVIRGEENEPVRG